MAKKKDPIKEALKDPEVKKAVAAQAKAIEKLYKEGFCVENGCINPVAPGQTYVCTKHIRTN